MITRSRGRHIAFVAISLACAVSAVAEESSFRYFHRPVPQKAGTDSSTPPSTAITPQEMQSIYGFNLVSYQGQGQTIALIDWYSNPDIASDFATFNSYYGLPACTTSNGCFSVIYPNGSQPKSNGDSALEISLDVEWAHAIAPQAKILLVEAASGTTANLLNAISAAVSAGATVVSMSFGGSESSSELTWDKTFEVSGVTFIASAGDSGHQANWPAVSPFVIGVGGTTLTHNNGTWVSETAWSCKNTVACEEDGGTGGGLSEYESEPSYQDPFQNQGKRGVPDLAYDANPNTGVAIYDSVPYAPAGFTGGWIQIGGTSMGSPEIAALVAIANSERQANGKANLSTFPGSVYSFTADYHDITSGENGRCGSLCDAGPGYDFVTGVGTPQANVLIPALVSLP
jgi:subtilase family serine protease